jgi:hypothetical protein
MIPEAWAGIGNGLEVKAMCRPVHRPACSYTVWRQGGASRIVPKNLASLRQSVAGLLP